MNKVDEAIQQYLDFNGLDIAALTEKSPLATGKVKLPGEEEEEVPPSAEEMPAVPAEGPAPLAGDTEDDAAYPGEGEELPEDPVEDVPNLTTPGGEQAWMDIALNAALWKPRDDQIRNKVVQIQSDVNAGIIDPKNIKREALPALLAIIGADVVSAADSEVQNRALQGEGPSEYIS